MAAHGRRRSRGGHNARSHSADEYGTLDPIDAISVMNRTLPYPQNNNATSSSSRQCALERLLCKLETPSCAVGRRPPCVKPLFVTGTAGSGTHFVADYLAKITGQHVRVKHEGPRQKPDVLVSWASRCPHTVKEVGGSGTSTKHRFKLRFDGLFPVQRNQKYLKPPMVKWAEDQISGVCSYRHVLHLVRHPLRFLSSNFAFGQCIECWTLVERLSVPPLLPHTAEVRATILSNRQRLYHQAGGREWEDRTRSLLVVAFARYWLNWNAMIEAVADQRIRVEDGEKEIRAVCVRYGLGRPQECRASVSAASVKKASHGGGQDRVTWGELQSNDQPLEGEVWRMAERYGYGRDVPAAPPS